MNKLPSKEEILEITEKLKKSCDEFDRISSECKQIQKELEEINKDIIRMMNSF